MAVALHPSPPPEASHIFSFFPCLYSGVMQLLFFIWVGRNIRFFICFEGRTEDGHKMALDLVSWDGLSIYGSLYNCH